MSQFAVEYSSEPAQQVKLRKPSHHRVLRPQNRIAKVNQTATNGEKALELSCDEAAVRTYHQRHRDRNTSWVFDLDPRGWKSRLCGMANEQPAIGFLP
jgi:hypothetical protein